MNKKQFEDGIDHIYQIDDNLFVAKVTWRQGESYIDVEGKAEDFKKSGYIIDSINKVENTFRFRERNI